MTNASVSAGSLKQISVDTVHKIVGHSSKGEGNRHPHSELQLVALSVYDL